jgi:hypothetical protein
MCIMQEVVGEELLPVLISLTGCDTSYSGAVAHECDNMLQSKI